VVKCKKCLRVFFDTSNLCSTCGSVDIEPYIKPQASNDVTPAGRIVKQRAFPSVDSIQPVVISRSFSTFFEHPFVFVGLCFLAQIPGAAVSILLRDLGIGGRIFSTTVSFIFALIVQGAITYGVYESLRGYAAEFGESLVRGMTRSGPLLLGGAALLGSFILEVSFGAMMLDADILVVVGSLAGIFLVALPALLIFLSFVAMKLLWEQLMSFFPAYIFEFLEVVPDIVMAMLVPVAIFLVYKSPCFRWAVFVPACVVEDLGPIASLNRSSELLDGFLVSSDIIGLNWKYLLGAITFMVFGYAAMAIIALMSGSQAMLDIISIEPNSIFESLFRMLIIAIPMAFGYVMIAVTYYELRNAKEQVRYYYC